VGRRWNAEFGRRSSEGTTRLQEIRLPPSPKGYGGQGRLKEKTKERRQETEAAVAKAKAARGNHETTKTTDLH